MLSPILPHMHEVVHVMLSRVGRNGCPSLISEGLAEIYDGPGGRWESEPVSATSEEIRALMRARDLPLDGRAYSQAAHFVSYLLERYGPGPVIDLCETLAREPKMKRWESAVRGTLGVTLDELLEDYQGSPACSLPQLRAKLWGCSGDVDHSFAPGHSIYVVDGGCDDAQATNAVHTDEGTGAVLLRRVYLTGDALVEMDVRAIGDAHAEPVYAISECGWCSDQPRVYLGGPEVFPVHYLRPGMHELLIYFDRRDRVRLTMSVVE